MWRDLTMQLRSDLMQATGIFDPVRLRLEYDEYLIETYDLDYLEKPNEYDKGGSIHIKPLNRGKFTALKKRTGHSASWFKAHGTPAQKKMATFELNAKKWHHKDDGGYLDDIIWDNMGLWNYPGRITGITGNKNGTDITTNGVADYLIGKDNLGNVKFMKPGRNYHFPGSSVVEYPLKYQFGGLFKKKPQVNYLYSTYGLNDYGQPRYEGSYNNPIFGYQPLSGINQSIGRDYYMPDYSTAAIVKTPMYMVERPEPNIDKAVLAKKFAADFILLDGIENTMNSKYYDKKLDRWIPQDSVEGGAKTIGKGLKMNNTNANWYKILNKLGYLTNDLMEAGVLEMVDKFYDRARKTYDNRIGAGSFDLLDPNKRAILIDYAYNGVLNKFNNFMDAVAADDKEKILNNYVRYTGGKKLGLRNDKTLEWINSTWPDKHQYGGIIKPFSYTDIPVVRYDDGGNLFLDERSKMPVFRSPEELLLLESYVTPERVLDNTRLILQPILTPQLKSLISALKAFYERHKSPEAEKQAALNARNAVKAERYTELSRTGQINNADLDTRTLWSKNWPRAKNWIDNHFSLVGDLKDATNGIVDLKYFIPGVGLAILFGDMAKDIDDGKPANALIDATLLSMPYYNQLKSAGTNIANQWVMPRGMAGSYELRFQNILKPSYWREITNPNSYNEAVEQVKHFHDAYRAPRIAGNNGWIINKDIVDSFRGPLELNFNQNINIPKIKMDRRGNIKSIKVDKSLLFEKGDIKNPQIIPSNPLSYMWNLGIKGFFNSTGVNHGGTKFYLNYAHPELIGVDPKILKGIAAHEMQHSALKLIRAPYLSLSMPRDRYFGPNIFFLETHPNINFDVMDAKDPDPDFIDRLIRFKDNTATFLKANPFELRKLKFDHSPIKSRKSNLWYRSPDELDAEMANFRYLYDINVPLIKMPTDLLNKAIDVMSRRFKVSSRDNMGDFMMQLSNVGYFYNGGYLQ